MTQTPGAPNTLSLAAFCDHINVKRSYGHQLRKEGRLVMADDGKHVLVAESKAKIEETRDPSKAGVAARHAAKRGSEAQTGHAENTQNQPLTPAEPAQAATNIVANAPAMAGAEPADADGAKAQGYDFQTSKAKREHFAALEAEASYRQKIRELLDASEVRAVVSEIITILRTSIEGIPYNLAPVLAATSDETEIKSLLHADVEHALKTASDSLSKLGRGEF